MKKYIGLFLIAIFISFTGYAQEEGKLDSKSRRNLTKQEKAELRKAEEQAMAHLVDSLINERRFVLEADFLSNQTGNRRIVNNLINFIMVDSSRIVIQTASTTGLGGYNGMGGITTRGNITGYEVKKTGRNNSVYYVRLMANTTIGHYDIYFNISPNSVTNATIGGLRAGKLNYHGVIKPLENSRVYQGMTI